MPEQVATIRIRFTLGIVLLLTFSTLVVYWQVKDHQFVQYDDDRYITDNRYVRQGLTFESVTWAFTTGHASNWHPLTWLSHMVDYELFGSNPAGHLLTNVILHIINTIVLFLLLMKMTERLWESAFVAALFALHPLHVESVAWAAERKDTLSFLFWLLTTWAYVRYTREPKTARMVVVAVVFGLGLLAKPMLVTLPFVLLLLDFWPLNRLKLWGTDTTEPFRWSNVKPRFSALVWEKLALFTLAAILSNVTYVVQQAGGAMSTEQNTPLMVRGANAVMSYVGYIEKMFWPSDLAAFYPHFAETVHVWQIIAAAVFLLAVSAAVVLYARQLPYIVVGWFWYLGILVPVIGLVQVGAQAMADRYTYIPLIGLFIVIVWGVADLSRRWRRRELVLAFSGVSILVVLMVLTWRQVGTWKDGVTLFGHAISVTERNWLAHHNVGVLLAQRGEFGEAEVHFRKTLEVYPRLSYAHVQLARVLEKTERMEEAIEHYVESVRSDSQSVDARVDLATALLKKERYAEAVQHLEAALVLSPDDVSIQSQLIDAREKAGAQR